MVSRILRTCASRAFSALGALLLIGCGVQEEARFWRARPILPEAQLWQVYYDGAWRDIEVDGIRPPFYVGRHILDGGNRFLFAGVLDTHGVRRTDLPKLHLQAWNLLPPLRRRLVASAEPDTTGVPWLTEDDFPVLADYQRFMLSAAAIRWPWRGQGMELPPEEQPDGQAGGR